MPLPVEINLRRVLGTLLFGVIVAAAVAAFWGRTACGSKLQRVRGDFSSIGSALRMYRANNGQLPSTPVGLDALVHRPADLPATAQWTRLMDDIPRDPWGSPYRYLRDDSSDSGFRLFSTGPDLGSFSRGDDPDDIASWDPARPYVPGPPPPGKAPVVLLVAGVFLAGGLTGIFLKGRPERLFVYAS